MLGRCLSLSHDGLLDCSHLFWAHSLELVSLGGFSKVMQSGWLPVPYIGGASLLLCNVVNRALSDVQVILCQYVVFIIKLILSYLPVCLTYSLPTSPLARICDVDELAWFVGVSWVCPWGLPAVRYRQQAFGYLCR